MQRFTIDFLTGNTRGSYAEGVVSTDAEVRKKKLQVHYDNLAMFIDLL